MPIIRTLQLFREYLRDTENWCFTQLDQLADVEVTIASHLFHKRNYYSSKFKYVDFPISKVAHNEGRPAIRHMNSLISPLVGYMYPYYLLLTCPEIDLVHAHFPMTAWKYRPFLRSSGKPVVVSFYGVDYESFPYRFPIWKSRYRKLFLNCQRFICEGQHGARILESHGCPPEKIRINPLGILCRDIQFVRRSKRQDELSLIQVATFTEKKGHIYTVEAFLRALRTCPNMTLTLVGGETDANITATLRRRISGTIGEDRVTFVDAVDHSRLNNILSDHHVFIQPSCYSSQMDCEGGAPVVLLEAQATGMPVIATTHCDIPNEVVHERTGYLASEKDVRALSAFIERFYRMGQDHYDDFCRAARSHVEKNFDAVGRSMELRKIYEECYREDISRIGGLSRKMENDISAPSMPRRSSPSSPQL
jgi:colanic acid/amylovoran biosynthesis glycosyltransferase